MDAIETVVDDMGACVRLIEAAGGARAEEMCRWASVYVQLAPRRRGLDGVWVTAIERLKSKINLTRPVVRAWGRERGAGGRHGGMSAEGLEA